MNKNTLYKKIRVIKGKPIITLSDDINNAILSEFFKDMIKEELPKIIEDKLSKQK